jgi:UrcA family protein
MEIAVKIAQASFVLCMAMISGSFLVSPSEASPSSSTTERITVYPSGPYPDRAGTSLSIDVSYADLDLSKRADVAKLEERIDGAALQVCDKLDQAWSIHDIYGYDRMCVADAQQKAQSKMPGIRFPARYRFVPRGDNEFGSK